MPLLLGEEFVGEGIGPPPLVVCCVGCDGFGVFGGPPPVVSCVGSGVFGVFEGPPGVSGDVDGATMREEIDDDGVSVVVGTGGAEGANDGGLKPKCPRCAYTPTGPANTKYSATR